MDWKKIYKKINIYIEREKLIRLKNEMEEKLYNVIIILRNTNNVFFLIYVLIRIFQFEGCKLQPKRLIVTEDAPS